MITLPLRLGACATRLGIHLTTRAAGVAVAIPRRLIARPLPTESPTAASDAEEASGAFGFGVVIAAPPAPPDATPVAAPAPPVAAPEAVPTAPSAPEGSLAPEVRTASEFPSVHVSEGLQFVEAFAEPGAEAGAGAAVHIKEPWRGYAQMTATEVIVRLAEAGQKELAAIALYEGVHRRRKTVLEAARRQLRLATASSSAARAGRA